MMRILLAVDDSRYSWEAVETVATRPWPLGSSVRVLSAVKYLAPSIPEVWYGHSASFEALRQEMIKSAEQLSARVAKKLIGSGLRAEPVVREGDPRRLIVTEAQDWHADLIVVGSHGYEGLKRWLLGSVAQSVLIHAPCSVEVVQQRPTRAMANLHAAPT